MMATPQQLQTALANAQAAGDTQAVQVIQQATAQMAPAGPASPPTAAAMPPQSLPDPATLSRAYYRAQAAGDEPAKKELFHAIVQQGGHLLPMDAATLAELQQQQNAQIVDNTSGFDNFRAGAGKAFTDTWRGVKQLNALAGKVLDPSNPGYAGQYDELKQEQSDTNTRDKALLASKAGLGGNIFGYASQLLAPAGVLGLAGRGAAASALLPSTLAGTAAQGAGLGLLQPLDADQGEGSRLGNIAIGTAGGLLGHGATRVLGAGLRGAKALVEPFFNGGQEAIVARALSRFGKGGSFTPEASAVPGVQSTLGEATGNRGLAQLQNVLANASPDASTQFAARRSANNAARYGLLQDVAGTPEDLSAAMARRDELANVRYGQAFDDAASQRIAREGSAQGLLGDAEQAASQARDLGLLSPGGGSQAKAQADALLAAGRAQADNVLAPSSRMQALAQRPAIQAAAANAVKIAKNAGKDIGNPLDSLEGQHYMKMALDDAMNVAKQQGVGKAEQNAIGSARAALLDEIERQNPAYASARESFRNLSGPVNAIELGQGLLGKLSSPVVDDLGNPVLTPAKFGASVKSLDQLAQKVTGQKRAVASDILTAKQQQGIQAIMGDLNKQLAADNAGRAVGSNTAKNLAGQNILQQSLGGLADFKPVQYLGNAVNKIYAVMGIPDELQGKLTQAMLNPNTPEAQAILSRIPSTQRKTLDALIAPLVGTAGNAAGRGVRQ